MIGLINANGTVSELRRIGDDENSAESIAGTPEEGRAQIGSLVMHSEARAGPLPLQFGEATFAQSQPIRVAMGPVGWNAGRFEPLLAREAATITIELCG